MFQPFGIVHIAFLAILGLAGWGALIGTTVYPPSAFRPWEPSFELVGCLILVTVARLLAFRVFGRVRIAIDSAFYIAVRFVFGAVPAAWLISITLTADALMNHFFLGRGLLPRGEAPLRHTLAHSVYAAGLPSLVLLGVSVVFVERPLTAMADTELLWSLPAFTMTFLGVHYFLAGGATWFIGASSGALWRRFLPRALGAELTLVTLSLAMVLAYKHQGVLLFMLIGVSGVLFGGIFRRWTLVRERLAERVQELQAINRIQRIISASYDRPTLFSKLSKASLELVGHSSLFLIGLLQENGEDVKYEVYDGNGQLTEQMDATIEAGLSGWVIRNEKPLVFGDVQKQYRAYVQDDRYNDERYHSWLAVPLKAYGKVIGVCSAQSTDRDAYTEGHLRVLTTIADTTAVAIEASRFYQLATVDGLTGLFVRRFFDQRLLEEWDRTARYGNSFTLGLFDLDRFKRLNDTHGHLVGDQVLREAAQVVRENMRSFDIASRYGGEEFVFILPRTTLEEAATVAERIRADVEKLSFKSAKGDVRVTVSIGLAACPSSDINSPAELVSRVDEALYKAKAQGRNRVVLSDAAA